MGRNLVRRPQIILVAAFNILSTLLLNIYEKRLDISIFKSLGMRKSNISKLFVFYALFITSIGTVLGTLLGLFFYYIIKKYPPIQIPEDIYNFKTLPIFVSFFDIILILSIVLILSFFASLYPSYKVAKNIPLENLRYD